MTSKSTYIWVNPRRASWSWKVLRSLCIQGQATCADLQARMGGTHETVSARLQELEEFGLVSRWSPPHEPGEGPSKSIFRLTPSGFKLLERANAPEVLSDLYAVYRQHIQDRADSMREAKAYWRKRIAKSMYEAVKASVLEEPA